jgi:hypothetical protein
MSYFRFQVSDFIFHICVLAFHNSVSGFHFYFFICQFANFRIRISDFRFQISEFSFQFSDFSFQFPIFKKNQISDLELRLGILLPGNWAPDTGGVAGRIPGEPRGSRLEEPSGPGFIHRFFQKLNKTPEPSRET